MERDSCPIGYVVDGETGRLRTIGKRRALVQFQRLKYLGILVTSGLGVGRETT